MIKIICNTKEEAKEVQFSLATGSCPFPYNIDECEADTDCKECIEKNIEIEVKRK